MSKLLNFIANTWVEPDEALPATLCDSNTGVALAQQVGSGAGQVEAALASAQDAYLAAAWSGLGAPVRAAKLDQIAELLAASAADLARQDAQEVVERFGVMGRRKFNLAA